VIAVCGGGDAGISEALYLANLPAKVVLIEAMPDLTATAVLQDSLLADERIEVRRGTRVVRIIGDEKVEAIELTDAEGCHGQTLAVDGVLVHVGIEPNTGYLRNTLSLDDQRLIAVDSRFETEAKYVLAAGDIRSGSPRQVATAVGDGAAAAITAQKLLRTLP
jgi:thioredoxin reductase (NADPH)